MGKIRVDEEDPRYCGSCDHTGDGAVCTEYGYLRTWDEVAQKHFRLDKCLNAEKELKGTPVIGIRCSECGSEKITLITAVPFDGRNVSLSVGDSEECGEDIDAILRMRL